MDKHQIHSAIIDAITADFENYMRSARASRAEAADEENKAESKYDTRGLETSYLAQGQSQQAMEARNALKEFQSLPIREFGASDPVDVGALVEAENRGERNLYFIGPRAGGTEIVHEGRTTLVVTPQSPLGSRLIGARRGDRVEITIGKNRENHTITAVW